MKEPTWLRTLRAHVRRSSITAVSRKIGYSRSAVNKVLTGRYKHRTNALAKAVRSTLKPARTTRPTLPPQLRQLDKKLHARFKRWTELCGARTVAAVVGIDEARVWPLIRGRDPRGAADVLELIQRAPFDDEREAA